MKITIEISSPDRSCISAKIVSEILHELGLCASRRGADEYYEQSYRLHIAAVYAYDSRNDGRVCGELFLEPANIS